MTGRQVNVYLQEKTYSAVRQLVGPRKISRYINQALEEKLEQERNKTQDEFQQKLIRGCRAMAENKKLQKELAIWDETLTDGDKQDE